MKLGVEQPSPGVQRQLNYFTQDLASLPVVPLQLQGRGQAHSASTLCVPKTSTPNSTRNRKSTMLSEGRRPGHILCGSATMRPLEHANSDRKESRGHQRLGGGSGQLLLKGTGGESPLSKMLSEAAGRADSTKVTVGTLLHLFPDRPQFRMDSSGAHGPLIRQEHQGPSEKGSSC